MIWQIPTLPLIAPKSMKILQNFLFKFFYHQYRPELLGIILRGKFAKIPPFSYSRYMKQKQLAIIVLLVIVLLGVGGIVLFSNNKTYKDSTTESSKRTRIESGDEAKFTFSVQSEVKGYEVVILDGEKLMNIIRDDLQTYHVVKTPNVIVALKAGDVSGENIAIGRIFIDAPSTKVTTYIEITIDEKVIFDDKITPVQKGIYFQEALFRILPFVSKTTAVEYNRALIREGHILFNINKVN